MSAVTEAVAIVLRWQRGELTSRERNVLLGAHLTRVQIYALAGVLNVRTHPAAVERLIRDAIDIAPRQGRERQ